MTSIEEGVDAKLSVCISFVFERLAALREVDIHRPLVVGLNGIQGVGKTTLVAALTTALGKIGVRTVTCSIDDFYLTRDDQVALARAHADNPLLQHRGEPGTHDVALAAAVLASLIRGEPTQLPQYDKAACGGHGDRRPSSSWLTANEPGQSATQAVILEGWCVGFRPLSTADVQAKWQTSTLLSKHQLEHLLSINEKLAAYETLTNLFDAFIHIDADDTQFAYQWRQQQEDSLRGESREPSIGMTPEQVSRFVDGYVPGYELYTERLRSGVLMDRPGCQLRLLVDRDRRLRQMLRL